MGCVGFAVLGGEAAFEAQFAAAGGAQLFHQLRMLVPHESAQAGEERVAVAQVADAAALPMVEGRIGVALWRRRVAVEDDDLAIGPGQRHGAPQARHSRSDNQDAFAHA